MFGERDPERPLLACRRALVADDDPTMRDILGSLLTDIGYTVVLAASGREALNIVSDEEFSVAFVDLAMPNGNGLQTCAALRELPKWNQVPIIVLTHYSIGTALKAALRAGASGFLCKPIVPSELLWCLENQLGRKKVVERSDFTAIDGFDPRPVEERPASARSEWMLRVAFGASLDLEWEDLNVPSPSVSLETSGGVPIASTPDDKPPALAHQNCPVKATGSANLMAATSVSTLSTMARLFPPGDMPRFLATLVASMEKILSMLHDSNKVLDSGELSRRLHNLAGSAGTLGCGALSDAARDLEYDRSGSDQVQQTFVEIARATLKVIDAYIAGSSDSTTEQRATGSPHVLIVDDTEMTCEIAEAFLRSVSYNVTCVHSGAEAITAVATTDFQVVLMDVRMPGMDGLEATRRIRALEGRRGHVPIVALTALAFADQIAACREAGMDGHLAKPFSPDTLLAAVRAQLDRRM